MGKTFEKETKTIEDRGEKQVKAIKDNINTDYKNELLLSKEREIFKNIYNERFDKIEELFKISDYDNLHFIVQGSGDETNFKQKIP